MDEINDTAKKLGDKTCQIDLENNPLYSFIHHKKEKELQSVHDRILEEVNIKKEIEVNVEPVINIPQDIKRMKNKFILLDPIHNGHNMTFKLKNDLLPDLIDSFLWIKVWMEYNKYDIMKALGMDGKSVLISKQEIDIVISTLKNLDRIAQDK